jgi:hypothetical protein
LFRTRTRTASLVGLLLSFAPYYSRDLATWTEVSYPRNLRDGAGAVWSYAANYSGYEWRVVESRHGVSAGSIIEISRPAPFERWQAREVLRLDEAPSAVSVRSDGTAFVTLDDALVSVDANWHLQPVLTDAPWPGLYPNSSVLSQDGAMLFIGMRQYVGVVDLAARSLRLFVPSKAFLNRLPEEEERRIFKQFNR